MMGNTQNNYIQNFGVETSWGIFTCKTEKKRRRKDTIKIDVRLVVRMKSGRNWRYYSVAVSDSVGHFSLSYLRFTHNHYVTKETVSQTFTESADNLAFQ